MTIVTIEPPMQGQNPDAGTQDGDFMSEAKDWAGELISGQVRTHALSRTRFEQNITTQSFKFPLLI